MNTLYSCTRSKALFIKAFCSKVIGELKYQRILTYSKWVTRSGNKRMTSGCYFLITHNAKLSRNHKIKA